MTATAAEAVATPGNFAAAPSIEAEALRRTFRGRRGAAPLVALDGVSLRVAAGSWAALLGPNGAGKSTLMRVLATLDAADGGSARVMGKDVARDAGAVRAVLGVVAQRPGLDPLLTVRENLACQAALFGMAGASASGAIERAAADAGVADRLRDRVGALSGGLARRVDLARAMLSHPEVLLLDEPTAGLDHEARSAFLDLLRARQIEARARGGALTILMSTHLMDEAERADEAVLVSRGRVVGSGTPSSLRGALGGMLIEAGPEAQAVLRSARLAVAARGDGWAATGAAVDLEAAAAALARSGIAFSFGPPTLGDVYLALAGESLAADAEGGAASARQGRRRWRA